MPRVKNTTIKIVVDYGGDEFTVLMDSISLGQALGLTDLSPSEQVEIFASRLREWDVEDERGPVPCTLAGVRSLDIRFVSAIRDVWIDAITAVPAPLEKRSSDSLPWEGAPIPTEILS